MFEELFAPGRKHTDDERKRLELTRVDLNDGDPGRGPIDLTSGKVVVRVPRQERGPEDRPESGPRISPEHRPEDQPEHRPEDQPESRPEDQPEGRPGPEPDPESARAP
ncbi:DUF6191 domain-containing protein [Streptomyces rhizosphaerihabitans]|uniref:DUF6191 domain-containing protein n=1 Tax=Streptomyces rhizosphaerihabitans TaxID=1266770 RepID=UPI003703EEC5